MRDIEFLGVEFDNVEGFKMLDMEDNTVTYTEDGSGSSPGSYGTATWTKGYQQGRLYVAPTFENFEEGYFESAPNISTSLILEGKSVTPSETAQTVSPTSTDYYLSTVNVGAIPSNYVGSGVTQRDSTDLTASGATVTAPAGYYESAATKTVASGSEGTPTATKGTVSNHSIAVTPSVTNGAGYIAGGTHTGTAVTVSASELVSGSETKTANGTYDVTNLAELVVNVSGQSPTGTKNISITQNGVTTEDVGAYASAQITTNVPNTYSQSDEGKVVSNGTLVTQGSDTVTTNGTVDTTLISSLTVNVSAGTGYTKYKTGTYTPSQTYNTTGNRAIVTIADLGFTPSKFIMAPTDLTDISGIQYAIVGVAYEKVGYPEHYRRTYTRYSNTSNSLGQAGNITDWTTQANGYFYLNNGTIYYRTASNCILVGNVSYTWYAYE